MNAKDVRRLLHRAEELGSNAASVEAAEQAVRQADLLGDLELQRYARSVLISQANFSGFPRVALVAFTWSLAKLDEEPSSEWEEDLLWKYKWILRQLIDSPEFSCDQTDRAYADAERRYSKGGFSARPLLLHRAEALVRRGEAAEAAELVERALSLPIDDLADCRACEPEFPMTVRLDAQDWEGALRVTAPLLDGRLSCAEQPEFAQCMALEPLVELGRLEEAVQCHHLAFARTLELGDAGDAVAEQILFLLRTENHGKAVEAFSTYWSKTLNADAHATFRFSLAAALLFRDLAQDSRRVSLDVRIPRQHSLHGTVSGRDADALAAYFDRETRELAKRFDERFRKTRYAAQIETWEDRLERRMPYALDW